MNHLAVLVLSVVNWHPHPHDITDYKSGTIVWKEWETEKSLNMGYSFRDLSDYIQAISHPMLLHSMESTSIMHK